MWNVIGKEFNIVAVLHYAGFVGATGLPLTLMAYLPNFITALVAHLPKFVMGLFRYLQLGLLP